MTTVNQIVTNRSKEHDRITKAYYKDHTMSKTEFDQLHKDLDTNFDITIASNYVVGEKSDLEKLVEHAKSEGWIN